MRSFFACLLLLCSVAAFTQTDNSGSARGEGPIDPTPPQGVTVDQIIQKFAAKETEFR